MAESTQESVAPAVVAKQSSADIADAELIAKVLNAPCNQKYENLQALAKSDKIDSRVTSEIFQANSDIHRYIEVSQATLTL
jgi:hypothetical protein